MKVEEIKLAFETNVQFALIDDAFKSYNEGYDKWINSKQNLVGKASIEMGLGISRLKSSVKFYEDFIAKAKEIGADTKGATSQLATAKSILSLAENAKSKLDSI